MRKLICLIGLVALGTVLGGCATVGKTADENVLTWNQIAELDARQVADDWNLIWFGERQTRLTRFNTR